MPALDGLRAFAVTAVIAYHLNLTRAGGGYLGVDVFFVLSGFLITGLLVEERARTGGIAFRAFWARRARRLLPALVLMLAALALYAGLGGPGIDRSSLRPDSLTTLFYSANWHLIFGHQSYFAQFTAPSPLKHTWSLAIEEQFYLLWPLILVVLLRVTRGSRRALTSAILVMAAGSAVLMALLYHPGTDPSRIYYGTDTRAFELLIGAALAVVVAGRSKPSRAGRRVLHGAGLVAMALLVYFCVSAAGPPGWMWDGGLFGVGIVTVVVIASVSQARSGPLGALFSLPPVRAIGVISYGLYLWHWPVIVLMTHNNTGLSVWPLRGAQVATMLALATTSYFLVERPIRRARFKGWRAWLAAPAAVVATAGGLVLATVTPTTVAAAAPPPVSPPPTPAVVTAGQAGLTPALVVGDGTASALAADMTSKQSYHALAVHDAAGTGCTIVDGFTAQNTYGPVQQVRPAPSCQWRTRWPQQLQQSQPKVVFLLFGADDTADHLVGRHWLRLGTPEWQAYYQDQLGQMVSLLSSGGARVVMATMPQYQHVPTRARPGASFADPARVGALNSAYRVFAANHSDVTLYDLASQMMPGDIGDGAGLSAPATDRFAEGLDTELAMIGNPTLKLPPGRVLSPADPLRVLIVGDSVMQDSAPGITAALQATGVVQVVDNDAKKYWGLEMFTGWKTAWPRLLQQYRPELVVGMWSWDGWPAHTDPVGYGRLVEEAVGLLLAPGSGVDGVAMMEFPRSRPATSSVDPGVQAQSLASAAAGAQAWNSVMASVAPQWPGQYLYLPTASSLEVNGQYSAWLPAPGGALSRARKIDNFHVCPTGSARLGEALVAQLTPALHLPAAADGWWTGSWTKNHTYNDPPGACPDDHP
jgi:peptidoglycan/LPS O-acetylase OafA/YrhL